MADASRSPAVAIAPNPGGQADFIACPADEAILHGPRGRGATLGLLMSFAVHTGRGWGSAWRGVLFRRTLRRLRDAQRKAWDLFSVHFPGATYNRQEKIWTFPGGETLEFAYLDTPEDYANYHGQEFTWIGFDELCEWKTPEGYEAMKGCLRTTHPEIRTMIRSATNPWGPGKSWVRRYFFIEVDTDRLPIRGPDGRIRVAVWGRRSENVPLMTANPEYDLAMRNHHDPAKRVAWGEDWGWDTPSGTYFEGIMTTFDGKRSPPVVKPFVVPTQWPMYRLLDHGSAKPFGVLWVAVADGETAAVLATRTGEFHWTPPKGSYIAVHEWWGGVPGDPNRGLGIGSTAMAQGILRREHDWGIANLVLPGPADGIWGGSQPDTEQQTIAERMLSTPSPVEGDSRVGVKFISALPLKTRGSRVAGALLLRERLAVTHQTGELTEPGFWITEECPMLIHTLTTIGRDAKEPDAIATDEPDHLVDLARYLCLWHPWDGGAELDLAGVDWSGIGPQMNFGV